MTITHIFSIRITRSFLRLGDSKLPNFNIKKLETLHPQLQALNVLECMFFIFITLILLSVDIFRKSFQNFENFSLAILMKMILYLKIHLICPCLAGGAWSKFRMRVSSLGTVEQVQTTTTKWHASKEVQLEGDLRF